MEVAPAQGPQSLPSYHYEPLKHPDSTRVLVLHPAGAFESQLLCSIIQYSRQEQLRSVDTTRNYSAVSYTWGEPDFSVDLIIDQSNADDDITPKKSLLKITPTVDTILRYLRGSHKPVHLWIDALCINQQDENDKAVQIPQMGAIYKCADMVHVWLGDVDADEVAIAFANVRMIHASPATESYKADLFESLATLTQKPWFTRRWVIQEIKLADRAVLRYGEHSVEYARFRTAWYLVESRMLSQDNMKDLRPLLNRDSTDDFLELLWGFHLANCADPRDRLAALYGFLPPSEQPIGVQYAQIGWEEMYRRLAERLINGNTLSATRVILHLFAFGSAARRVLDDSEYPSWVPDWSGIRQPGMASGEFCTNCQHSADRADRPWIDCSNEISGSETEGPYLKFHLNDSLSRKEKDKLWLQEAQQDIPGGSGCFKSLRALFATRFYAREKKLRARWSPIRGGLYGKSARLILKLPRELVEGEKLWERALSCLKPIQDRFVTPKTCLRVMALFAIILRGKDVVSKGKDDLSSWSLHKLMDALYETFRVGFENPESLARGQILLLTLIGGVLRKFAFVELHPSPYSLNDDPPSLEEYGLAPYDMGFEDILIPCDETKLGHFLQQSDMPYGWKFMQGYTGHHLVEIFSKLSYDPH
ncbi:hypothetical protein GCG54_00002474 [Colletotrichum gloeosporioides]|uniref:Heterokaryon incompatibility domain-containing protein n=1 Tax=Colletotrichum gloeosporioides TaxID=474922 RepID=A0A8H4CTW3_COLGL|nr:uncharacterized protein GCG54_00002474 [Colletotrichum gloeosporioides]KAF3810025.1 hypothetical protein GCG54_00002474 [Colletotrichum gloeosporioides]